jgi:CBS domain-containing protein
MLRGKEMAMNVADLSPSPTREPKPADSLGAIMTRDVVCVPPELDVDALAELFLQRRISGAPVVARDGTAIGIVSKTDVLRQRYENGDTECAEPAEPARIRRGGVEVDLGPGYHVLHASPTRVVDIMMPVSFSMPEDAPVSRAAALMALEGVHRIPIVAADGSVVGIVSALDVLRWLAIRAGYLVPSRST